MSDVPNLTWEGHYNALNLVTAEAVRQREEMEAARRNYLEIHRQQIAELERQLAEAKAEIETYAALINLQNSRMGRAVEEWRKAFGKADLVWPDLGELIEWLMLSVDLVEPVQQSLAAERDQLRTDLEKAVRQRDAFEGVATAKLPNIISAAAQELEVIELRARNAELEAVVAKLPHPMILHRIDGELSAIAHGRMADRDECRQLYPLVRALAEVAEAAAKEKTSE